MEAQWQADRAALRDLLHTRPDLTLKAMVAQIGRSYSWGKKWAGRLANTTVNDVSVLQSHSRARTTPFPAWDPLVLTRLEQIRLLPPEGLQRTPGPKAILYYLPRDADLRERGCRLPQSTSTIWKLLIRLGLLIATPPIKHQPEPLHERAFVDAGTSVLLSAQVHDDFHAETALEAVITFLQEYGRPKQLSFDHDPSFRWRL